MFQFREHFCLKNEFLFLFIRSSTIRKKLLVKCKIPTKKYVSLPNLSPLLNPIDAAANFQTTIPARPQNIHIWSFLFRIGQLVRHLLAGSNPGKRTFEFPSNTTEFPQPYTAIYFGGEFGSQIRRKHTKNVSQLLYVYVYLSATSRLSMFCFFMRRDAF